MYSLHNAIKFPHQSFTSSPVLAFFFSTDIVLKQQKEEEGVRTICSVRALLIDADQYLAILVIQSLAVNAAKSVKESNPTFCTTPGTTVS